MKLIGRHVFGIFLVGSVVAEAHGALVQNQGLPTDTVAPLATESHNVTKVAFQGGWQGLKQVLLELHKDHELKELAQSKDVDIVIAREVSYLGAGGYSNGGYYYYSWIKGSLVFTGKGLKLKSTDARQLYTTPSFAKTFSSGMWGKIKTEDKSRLATELQRRNLKNEIHKSLGVEQISPLEHDER